MTKNFAAKKPDQKKKTNGADASPKLEDLKEEARRVGLKGFSRLRKQELDERLNELASKEGKMLSKSQLKKRSGWTETTISRFLGKSDREKSNPKYITMAPMQLYRQSRVEIVEETPEFQQIVEETEPRRQRLREAAQQAAERRRCELFDWVHDLEIDIPIFEWETLVSRAYASHRLHQQEMGKDDPSSPSDVDRVVVNFLRHNCTDYEVHLAKMFGKTGKDRAYIDLKEKILGAIAEAYPRLESECERQIDQTWKLI